MIKVLHAATAAALVFLAIGPATAATKTEAAAWGKATVAVTPAAAVSISKSGAWGPYAVSTSWSDYTGHTGFLTEVSCSLDKQTAVMVKTDAKGVATLSGTINPATGAFAASGMTGTLAYGSHTVICSSVVPAGDQAFTTPVVSVTISFTTVKS